MGEVIPFRTAKLTGFIPDELPEPLATSYKEVRAELASLVRLRSFVEPIFDDRDVSESNPESGDYA